MVQFYTFGNVVDILECATVHLATLYSCYSASFSVVSLRTLVESRSLRGNELYLFLWASEMYLLL